MFGDIKNVSLQKLCNTRCLISMSHLINFKKYCSYKILSFIQLLGFRWGREKKKKCCSTSKKDGDKMVYMFFFYWITTFLFLQKIWRIKSNNCCRNIILVKSIIFFNTTFDSFSAIRAVSRGSKVFKNPTVSTHACVCVCACA